jgi:hypothetical protein
MCGLGEVSPVCCRSLHSLPGFKRFRRRGLLGFKRKFALNALAHNLFRAVTLLAALFIFLYAVLRHLSHAVHEFPERASQPPGLRYQSYPRAGLM